MSTQDNNSLEAKINAIGLKVGNDVLASTGLPTTASQLLFVNANKQLAQGDLPFTVPLAAGVTDTSFAAMSVKGQATGTANDLMHLTLVAGANATATIAGYYRLTVTDSAGVIVTGDYYAPFYTLG